MNGARFMCIISPRRNDVGSIRPKISPPEKALHDQMYLWNRTYHLGGGGVMATCFCDVCRYAPSHMRGKKKTGCLTFPGNRQNDRYEGCDE